MRRLSLAAAALLCCAIAHGQELQPGDQGYKHDELHAAYQKYFQTNQLHAFEALKRAADKLELGDQGYINDKDLTQEYQKVFDSGKCNCSTGECRPTKFEGAPVTEDNPHGVKFWVNRHWCLPNKSTYFLQEKDVPAALLKDAAHVCASSYVDPKTGCPALECVRVNAAY